MRKIVAALILITLSSCGGGIAKLPLPAELKLPKIKAGELMCLSDQALNNLAIRDELQTNRRKSLRKIIKQTH